MLQIRDHGVEDYAALFDMDATDVGVMTEDDRACLDELGEYLDVARPNAALGLGIWSSQARCRHTDRT
jgi:hypothetical protein